MTIEERIDSFVRLGELFAAFHSSPDLPGAVRLKSAAEVANRENPWFTPESIVFSLSALAESLTRSNLEKWISGYPGIREGKIITRTVCVIMAGNIPLVGFHDFLCVLLSGHRIVIKLSSKDSALLTAVVEILIDLNPEWKQRITLAEYPLPPFDAVIATGNNNSSRYFEYYFGKYPHLLRKNRNSIALITGEETEDELNGLADDIFLYFGMGCRSVSKIYLPEGYDLHRLVPAFAKYSFYSFHHKYKNNYDYNRTLLLMNSVIFFDTGHLILAENESLSSPVSVLHFQFYKDPGAVLKQLEEETEQIQCIVSRSPVIPNRVLPGLTQFPALWDYADQTDTMHFLEEL
jgi:hypothetical protein